MRAKGLWPKVEETFKQMDTAAKELECFKALQKQEQLAASHQINNIWEEVQKQKELERNLQKRYGDIAVEVASIQHRMDRYRAEAEKQEEIAARNKVLELAEGAANATVVLTNENPDAVIDSGGLGSTLPTGECNGEISNQQMDGAEEHTCTASNHEMNVDAEKDRVTVPTDVYLPDNMPSAAVTSSDEMQTSKIPAQDSVVEGDGLSNDVVATETTIGNDPDVVVDNTSMDIVEDQKS